MTSTTSNTVAKPRPASEGLLNEKWDHCLANLLVKSTLGAGFGIIFSVLLFKRRAFPAWVGLGFGAGRGYAECDREFKGAAGGVTKTVGERLKRSS
ncbi:DUF543-domain-containing protein [Morchella conica CCBAS932]|uniref:MICOS complex subunit MIC10 n=1 Tax=Morchella conica CCBAS932 TaxID=1392247 RepID=A0A3N4KBN7_9PEZI|nr:DUF543-domain-containing protein [Morchella conica CCBAS932]